MGDSANLITYPTLPLSFNLLLNTISTNGFLNGVSIAYRMDFDTTRVTNQRGSKYQSITSILLLR